MKLLIEDVGNVSQVAEAVHAHGYVRFQAGVHAAYSELPQFLAWLRCSENVDHLVVENMEGVMKRIRLKAPLFYEKEEDRCATKQLSTRSRTSPTR